MVDKSTEWMDEDVQGRACRPCEGLRMGTRGSMAGMAACDKAGGEGKVRRRLEESEAAVAAEGETGEEKGERFRVGFYGAIWANFLLGQSVPDGE
ncbi:hypothetical protein OsI_29183 [Oryza sativa Indica Group]|uniref:Uncharacterized protein n=1 Tax=Oryza sativa subsp. indica TaxID=39946 RepID=A2YV30_ORYSI|nr:hypothetical protein OsI_29183 [Oryza sativa Indica Group]